MSELNWPWITFMAVVPPLAGTLVAYMLWRSGQIILGNVAGTMVIFLAAIALILRESAEIDRITRTCLDAGVTCWPEPSAFVRHAIYAVIALIEVFGLFTVSLRVEQRNRDRLYSPEWR